MTARLTSAAPRYDCAVSFIFVSTMLETSSALNCFVSPLYWTAAAEDTGFSSVELCGSVPGGAVVHCQARRRMQDVWQSEQHASMNPAALSVYDGMTYPR